MRCWISLMLLYNRALEQIPIKLGVPRLAFCWWTLNSGHTTARRSQCYCHLLTGSWGRLCCSTGTFWNTAWTCNRCAGPPACCKKSPALALCCYPGWILPGFLLMIPIFCLVQNPASTICCSHPSNYWWATISSLPVIQATSLCLALATTTIQVITTWQCCQSSQMQIKLRWSRTRWKNNTSSVSASRCNVQQHWGTD